MTSKEIAAFHARQAEQSKEFIEKRVPLQVNKEDITPILGNGKPISSLKKYMEKGEHLPDFMKDFHDQKDLFEAIYGQWKDGEHKVLEDIDWVDAHVFTIDYFLWWLGLHGYKLQKIRSKGIAFYDPEDTIIYQRYALRGHETKDLKNAMK